MATTRVKSHNYTRVVKTKTGPKVKTGIRKGHNRTVKKRA